MYIDASALVAMILGEPEAMRFVAAATAADERVTSPIAAFEAVAGVARSRSCSFADARALVRDLLHEAEIGIVPITERHGEIAIDALERFGKGRHKAALNMGDCFGYAVAKAGGFPILFKGNDFSQTDLTDGAPAEA
ncbi:MAG: type II toxin-antitoxin system VapC family toxin [Methylocystis sp.]|nr:type II toxin-antitoxin system VapC family toxin [Methylocystis sp.]MBI3275870.1 type II toxin-antitoxin system VapC family toxin [Methylocystis sp.]